MGNQKADDLNRSSRFADLKFVLLILSMGVTSCKPTLKEGLYEGKFFKKMNSTTFNQPVRIDFKLKNPYSAALEVRDVHENKVEGFQVSWGKYHDRIRIRIPLVSVNTFTLTPVKLKKSGNYFSCYQGSTLYEMTFCIGTNQFRLNVIQPTTKTTFFSLNGSYAPQQAPTPFEPQQGITLSEAVERTITQGFETQIEYQRVLEAKEAATAAMLNLLPHFSFKDILALTTLAPASILSYVADFIPFLIPTRWLKLDEANDLREAEKVTLDILREDLTYQVSSVAYAYARDRSGRDFYQSIYQEMKVVHDHILELGKSEPSVIGSVTDELAFRTAYILNNIQQGLNEFENDMTQSRTALSLSLGFHNPLAIEYIDIEEQDEKIENEQELVPEEIAGLARERSLELKQIDYLLDNAQKQKEEYYFNWLDPDVPANLSISVSLFPYIARASAVIQELLAKREQLDAQVAQKATIAAVHFNIALRAHAIVQSQFNLVNQRLAVFYTNILVSKNSSEIITGGASFQFLVESVMAQRLRLNDTIAMYRVARTLVKRSLLENFYSDLSDLNLKVLKR